MSDIQITTTADTSQATQAFQKLQQQMNKVNETVIKSSEGGFEKFNQKMVSIGNTMKSFGDKMTKCVSAPLLGLGVASAKLASDFNETMNKVDVVFGKSADSIKKWADNSIKNFGIAKGTALDMASLFGDMGTSMGIPQEQMAGMAQKLTGLAGDLASFKNIKVDVAKTALNGIFTGETESLKGLGVVMTEANLKSFAMSQGIKKNISDMTEAEKVQLRYAYVMDKTANAQGDFARTSTGTANQARSFGEVLKELGTTFGENILPVITPLIAKLSELIKQFGEIDPAMQKIVLVLGAVLMAILPLITIMGTLISAVGTISLAVTEAGGVMALLTNPIGLVIAAIVALVAVFVIAYQQCETFRNIVNTAWTAIKDMIFKTVSDIVTIVSVVIALLSDLWKKHGDEIMKIVTTCFGYVLNFIQSVLGVISGVIKVFTGLLTGDWSKVWEGCKQIVSSAFSGIINAVSGAINLIKSVIDTGLNIALSVVKGIAGGIKNALVSAFDFNIPHIKLPHFKISGSFSLSPPSIPSIGVDWYAKGGIFTAPSVIGVGEAGDEAVIPLNNKNKVAPFANAVASLMPDKVSTNGEARDININITGNYIKDDLDINKMADVISEKLYKTQERTRRAKGINK